jgi:hypothetical protein
MREGSSFRSVGMPVTGRAPCWRYSLRWTASVPTSCVLEERSGLTPNLDALTPEWTTFTQAFAIEIKLAY